MTGMLAGRIALVTGASSGIGEGIAVALAAAGATVVLSARRASRLDDLVASITGKGGHAWAFPGDVAEETIATAAVEDTVKRFGRLDILVNSAGIIQAGGIENANFAEWRRVIDVNLMATVYTCKAAIPHMRAQGGGDIVNISSIAGRRAARKFAAYAPSKFALTAMTEAMRQEVGAHGIRVCLVEPGATETEVALGISDESSREMMQTHVSRQGVMLPEEVASMVVFILALPSRVNVSELLMRPTIDVAPI
jgi:NADP-dependent 3-hydroxy acid dehydrogenase YdfG